MTVTYQIKILNGKIKQNEAKFEYSPLGKEDSWIKKKIKKKDF